MNREIKFRGKDRENWHYGDLVQEIRHNDNKLFDGTMTHIRNFEYKNGDYIGDSFPVNSETIGQFTGLHDKNGKEIYEGDIVKITNKNSKVIPIKPLIAQIVWSEEYLAYILITTSVKDAFENLGEYIDYDIEVIGNICEDSKLLEGE